jgi:DNA-binding SARP family transcriptional activator
VALQGGAQRALLAALVLHANRPVTVERLIDEPSADARGEPALASHTGGYVLRVAPGALDAERFEGLAAEGRRALEADRPEIAADTLHRALALWRGPALADVAYESFAQAEIARLEELRLATLEARIDADLRLGRRAELVPEIEALVSAHPSRGAALSFADALDCALVDTTGAGTRARATRGGERSVPS